MSTPPNSAAYATHKTTPSTVEMNGENGGVTQ